ncbi:MAG: hypothetical protein VKJ04_03535 [Vampirovibrionales bacterium]|nr:hypothetical protein [Vampirovibrionales bacterium]
MSQPSSQRPESDKQIADPKALLKTVVNRPIRVAVFGFGGLGKGMARLIPHRPDFKLVAIADSSGYCVDPKGLNVQTVDALAQAAQYPEVGKASENAMLELLQGHAENIDAVFMALPNLPVDFFAKTVKAIAENTGFKGVFVDALKRTEAVERLFALNDTLRHDKILYITGAGATPGFLTTVAAVAAQSFVEVLKVDIRFGVGVANWENYKATVREDFIHLEGFDAKRVACMSDEEIAAELEARNGLIALENMEHADDIILELAGVCPRDRVSVGGLVDTRNAKKPISTQVSVTGRTMNGAVGTHQFIVSDEASMVDNVCGPALGFLLRGVEQWEQGHYGIVTSADLMPRFASQVQMASKADIPAERQISEKTLVTA